MHLGPDEDMSICNPLKFGQVSVLLQGFNERGKRNFARLTAMAWMLSNAAWRDIADGQTPKWFRNGRNNMS